MTLCAHDSKIPSTMRLSFVRPVDMEDMHPIYSTGFLVRTGCNLMQHVLSQIVIAVVLTSFRANTSSCQYFTFSVLILISWGWVGLHFSQFYVYPNQWQPSRHYEKVKPSPPKKINEWIACLSVSHANAKRACSTQ